MASLARGILPVLALVLHCAHGFQWSNCGDAGDVFRVSTVSLTPEPLYPGAVAEFMIVANSSAWEGGTSGTAAVIVTWWRLGVVPRICLTCCVHTTQCSCVVDWVGELSFANWLGMRGGPTGPVGLGTWVHMVQVSPCLGLQLTVLHAPPLPQMIACSVKCG